jgi:hypothetical protein
MTHPPQQPGPYGQDPYGQQPGPQPPGFDPRYGHPGAPGGPPPAKRSPWVIVAVVVGALLVLGGAGTGIYFLTKDDGQPGTAASGSTATTGPGAPTSDPGSAPTSQDGPATGTQPPPTSGDGGGGGGGGEAEIADVAGKYARAVTDKDADTAKALTCDKEPGILYDSVDKLEITGQPQKLTDDLATVQVRIIVGTAEPVDGYPLSLERKDGAWCVF